MELPSRRVLITGTAVFLAVVVATTGYAITVDDEPIKVTVENQHTDTHQVTVVQNSADSVTDMAFRVTTDEGTTQYVGLGDLAFNPGYQNTTLFDAERSTQITVTPGENTTITLDGWEDEATAYIVETPDGESLYADAVHCEGGDHSFYLKVNSDGTFLSSTQCK